MNMPPAREPLQNDFPRFELRRAAIDVLQPSLDFGKPGSLDALLRGIVEAGDEELRDLRSLVRWKLEGVCEHGVPGHVGILARFQAAGMVNARTGPPGHPLYRRASIGLAATVAEA
jgi:hypothetical protein